MNQYTAMIFAGACSYGVLSTIVKLAWLNGQSISWITLLQYAIGMATLWTWTFINNRQNKRRNPITHTRPSWLPVMASGATIGLSSFVYYVSVKYIPASLSIILLMQFTWMGLLLERLFFGRRPERTQLVAVGVILAGTIMASGLSTVTIGLSFLAGTGFALLSALLYALYIITNSRLGTGFSAPQKSALIMTGATLGILLVNVRALAQQLPLQPATFSWSLLLALFGTIMPPVLFARAMPKVGAGLSALIVTAELPVAVVCAHFILGEKMGGLQWTGVAIMLGAIVWMNRQSTTAVDGG